MKKPRICSRFVTIWVGVQTGARDRRRLLLAAMGSVVNQPSAQSIANVPD
jgi:hypothetical protein